MMASSASTSSVFLLRPPLISSPRPSSRNSPNSNRRATPCKCAALTRRAFSVESSPSLYDGNRRNSTSLTTRPSTLSPRNSNCSLSFTSVPPRVSEASELWVSARCSNSGLPNRCFNLNSRRAGSARMKGKLLRRRRRHRSLGGSCCLHRCGANPRCVVLDRRMHVRDRSHLVAPRDGFFILAAVLQRQCQAHHVRRFRRRSGVQGALERRRRRIVLLSRHVRQTDGVVGFGGEVLPGFRPLLVGNLRARLGQRLHHLDQQVGVLFRLA